MESADLTLFIHYANDLKDVKHFGTMSPYVVVWIAGYGMESQKITTPVAEKAGCYPEWEYPVKFHIVPVKREYSLFIQIKHDGTMFDRHIGEVEVRFCRSSRCRGFHWGFFYFSLPSPSNGFFRRLISDLNCLIFDHWCYYM
ncbi:unnamed protein product [Lactuca saligna]|uniref:C2 domain-containing protein n=1 Tax=Lactuca saligna TaxID=75948 RepID=A0AA35YBZ4_LACSI|nr:unnamed protein product [Lactuca saligna]